MKFDIYDTYATDPNGAIAHFNAIVPAGTENQKAKHLIHVHVGGDNPEIEMELSRWKSTSHWPVDADIANAVRRNGLAVVPIRYNWKFAG